MGYILKIPSILLVRRLDQLLIRQRHYTPESRGSIEIGLVKYFALKSLTVLPLDEGAMFDSLRNDIFVKIQTPSYDAILPLS